MSDVTRPKGGTGHHLDAARKGTFGATPKVGQSEPYVSGANAHQRHEPPARGPAPGSKSGTSRVDGPYGHAPTKSK